MPEIKLTHVTKRWGKFYAVDDLSLDMEDNSFITLLGPSGCGKTTTLRMIAGLETPTSGQIKIGDRVVFDSEAGINVPANKRKVGFLFQNYALWPNMTVYQNISFGLGNIKEELPVIDEEAKALKSMIKALENPGELVKLIEECRDKKGKLDLDMVYLKLIDNYTISIYTAKELYNYKLHEAADKESAAKQKKQELTAKLDSILAGHKEKGEELNEKFEVVSGGKVVTRVRKYSKEEIDLAVRRVSRIVKIGMFMNRYPAELSGGQQQRVAIARTLAPEPQVLFMDEPLSNLDAKLRLEMRYELQRLHVETGSTFVYVTHDQMKANILFTFHIYFPDQFILDQTFLRVTFPGCLGSHPFHDFRRGFTTGNIHRDGIELPGCERNKRTVNCTCQLINIKHHKSMLSAFVKPSALQTAGITIDASRIQTLFFIAVDVSHGKIINSLIFQCRQMNDLRLISRTVFRFLPMQDYNVALIHIQ